MTYCTNIHPGETWEEVSTSVWQNVLKVKERVSPDAPFPVGLRVSARAAREATTESAVEFLEELGQSGCFIPTINGFPFGSFHGDRVKEQAYLPDWRSRERVQYTLDLVRLLNVWLPNGITGSISTVPVGYRAHLNRQDFPLIRENLLSVLKELEGAAEGGKRIILALEPEPGCLLETAEDAIRFFETMDFPQDFRPFIGLCYDCCHGAVMFEEPRQALFALEQAGITVPKIQVSSAVRLLRDHAAAAELFREPRYLHQTNVRRGADILPFGDLPDALLEGARMDEEWRIHFHLPLYDDGRGRYGTTNGFIPHVLACRPAGALLEIETYTYDVLPDKPASITDSICREFEWLRSRL